MNHVKVLSRFIVVVFWLLLSGLLVTMVMNSGNAWSLSWVTILVYGIILSVVSYVGFFVSKFLWSIE
jgi:hypothetical protein